MSTPVVPPRPQRNSQQQAGPSVVKNDTPLVPPRPSRKTDPSPDRDARSPLNFPPSSWSSKAQVSKRTSQELPRRPPSVSLPTLGHEGEEYSSFDQLPVEAQIAAKEAADEQTRNVAADLPMHQPRASVPQSTATKNIQKVTDTDSVSAAAAGIGRARPADDVHKLPPGDASSPSRLTRVTSNNPRRAPSTEPPNALRAKASFNRSSSSLQPLERTTSRPASLYGGDDAEHGIPEIGRQVPLLAMAGDVQMPTPGTGASSIHAPGIGFFNDGSSRSHHRKRSSRHEFGPPDSYGIRHDQDHQDQFEKEWVKKHPEEAAKEGYYNHLPKPETALSSEQLNRIVFGDAPTAGSSPGTPAEEDAIEEYLSRVSTPAKAPTGDRKKRTSSDHVAPDSALRQAFANRLHPNDAVETEGAPQWANKYSVESDHEHEHADGTPILAADEMMKRPSSSYMHAAVIPEPHADDDYYYDSDHAPTGRRSSAQHHSRPSSRPSSVHGNVAGYTGGSLHRFVSREEEHHSGAGTPLEEIEEYEPLFPEDDGAKKKAAIQKARPDLGAMHHFPSQDVWEDTPSSLQYSAEVSTPELERMQNPLEGARSAASTFETPEQEQARRTQNPADMTSDRKTFMKPHFKSGVLEDMHESHRPFAHRFPSSDVWEDTPDSMFATTTVSTPEMDDTRSPPDDRPTTTAIPGSQDDGSARATTGHGLSARPTVPSRPERPSKLAQELPPDDKENKGRAPSIPDRPKPSIPARPQRAGKVDPGESAGLEKSLSGGSDEGVTSPPLQKTKPAVPARPAGSKIAALQAGFMNDLNNRLKLGPQGPAPKKEEAEVDEEAEKQPLVDARKSRARGPPRRKPAASPSSDRKSSATFAFSPLITVWTIDEEDELKIHSEDKENKAPQSAKELEQTEQILEENEKHNTESAAPAEDAADIASKIVSSPDPGAAAAEHHSSQGELEAALAEVGAGPKASPAPLDLGSPELSKAAPVVAKDEEVQIREIEKTTVVQGGNAKDEGEVVSKKVEDELSAS